MTVQDCLSLPIPAIVRSQAQQFAAGQATPTRGVRVYLNTLAVWTVHRYLQLVQIPTVLEQSHCWQPGYQSVFDSADLWVPRYGRLECACCQPGQAQVVVPPDAQFGRLGLVAVEVSETLDRATLLGYVPADPELPAVIHRPGLRSLDELLALCSAPPLTRLATWLHQEFEATWQPLAVLLRQPEPTWAVRSPDTIQRAQQLPWAVFALHLQSPAIAGTPPEPYQLGLSLHPLPEQATLPTELTMTVLTATGEVFRELKTRAGDTLLRYTLHAEPNERFTVAITLADETYAFQFEA